MISSILSATNEFGDEHVLVCPNCGCTEVHLNEVQFLSANGNGIIAKQKGPAEDGFTTMMARRKTKSSRRYSIVLKGLCESGCRIDIELVQHKGNTYVYKNYWNDPDPEW